MNEAGTCAEPIDSALDAGVQLDWCGMALADLDNPPEPDELAGEIIENLEAGLDSFRAVAAALG